MMEEPDGIPMKKMLLRIPLAQWQELRKLKDDRFRRRKEKVSINDLVMEAIGDKLEALITITK